MSSSSMPSDTEKLCILIVSPGFSELCDPLSSIAEDLSNGYSYREPGDGSVTKSFIQNSTLYKFKSLMRIKKAIGKIINQKNGVKYEFKIYNSEGTSVNI